MSSPAYEGGSGGYFKRRLFSNSARTPYERPSSAARGVRSTTTIKANEGHWLPTFMEPVSRFISRTASRLLSSVQPKQLSAQSGVEEKHLKLDTPIVILDEQNLTDCHSLITSNASGISDIEQFISQRWFTRTEAKHIMASINSRSSELLKSASENNKQVKVLKRDISFLDDDNVLVGPLCKIPKKSNIQEDRVVVNAPFTMDISGDQITNNEMNDASTCSSSTQFIKRSTNTTIASYMTFPPQRKSYFHMSAPEDVDLEDDVVEIKRSTNTLTSQRKSYFHMSAPEDIDDSDEEYDVTEESDQPLFNMGTVMNDGSTDTCGSNNEGDFTFPIIIDLYDHSAPPSPTMPSPSHVQLPFQKD